MTHEMLEKLLFQIAVTTTTADYEPPDSDDQSEPTPMPIWSEEFKLHQQFHNLFGDPSHD